MSRNRKHSFKLLVQFTVPADTAEEARESLLHNLLDTNDNPYDYSQPECESKPERLVS